MSVADINSLIMNPKLSNGLIDRTHIKPAESYQHIYPSEAYHHYYPVSSKKTKGKKNIVLTALTLLAFLFFLHLLQYCIEEQMNNMNPEVVIMQASLKAAREAEAKKSVGDEEVLKNKTFQDDDPEFKESKTKNDQYEKYIYEIPVKVKTVKEPGTF